MTKLTAACVRAIKWMQERGGDAAVARVKGGGRIILAGGEHAPFLPATCRALVVLGYAQYVDENGRKAARFRLTDLGKVFQK